MPGNSLVLTQSQQLKLNTQMLQNLEFMTLPLSALEEKIDEETARNPVLKVEEPQSRTMSYEEYSSKARQREGRRDDLSDSSAYGSDLSDSHQAWLEGAVTAEETLQEHLESQLGCVSCPEEVRHVASVIISSLDSNGFFTKEPESLLKSEEQEYLEPALSILHSLDPSGIAVKDFRESLKVQAENLGVKGDEKKAFDRLVDDELEKMRAGKEKEVARDLGIDEEELSALYDFLKTLTPYPATRFASGYESFIVPDLSIKKEDGKLVLRVNTGEIPELSVDPEYEEMASSLKGAKSQSEKEAAKYLKEQIRSAENLITQINMRNTTLERVSEALLKLQKGFFLFGPQSMKPLTLKQVAEVVGVHETTISRITTSKYIDTDWGVLPLKSFFSSALQSAGDSDGVSRNAVQDMIREIIENNTTGEKLTDQRISDILKEKGITCARRTVSKYRKALDIDSTYVRGRS